MKQSYEIDLSTAGIKELQKGLKDYDKWINKKTNELCKRLAEIGVKRAELNFSSALYDGINDVKVEPAKEREKNCYVVKANGATVLFIEFGTGVHYPDSHPEGLSNGMVHGTYGKGRGKNDYWWYSGQPGNAGGTLAIDPRTGNIKPNVTITHGNPANMCMYDAVKEVETQISRVVKEVFSQ